MNFSTCLKGRCSALSEQHISANRFQRTRRRGVLKVQACLYCGLHHVRNRVLPSHGQPLINIPLHPTPPTHQQLLVSRVSAAAKKEGGEGVKNDRTEPDEAGGQDQVPHLNENLKGPLLQQPVPPSPPPGSSGTSDAEENMGIRIALAMLRFYKNYLSPNMVSTCRYLPTCSEYSMLSYKQFGVWKGTVLTAWRLLRCNPLGSSGYDPPSWPPKGLDAVYGPDSLVEDVAPQITVLLGSVLALYIAQYLIKEISYIL